MWHPHDQEIKGSVSQTREQFSQLGMELIPREMEREQHFLSLQSVAFSVGYCQEEKKEQERKKQLLDSYLKQKKEEQEEDEQEYRKKKGVVEKLRAAAESNDQQAYNMALCEGFGIQLGS